MAIPYRTFYITGEKMTSKKNSIPIRLCDKYSLTIEEASSYFSIGETNLRQLCKEDHLSHTYSCKIGTKTVILRSEFEKYMREHHILIA